MRFPRVEQSGHSLSSGVSPAQLEEGSAVPDADIVAPGFVTEILKPKNW